MTKEDKELLLKDLCARLPYGVKVEVNYTEDKIIKELTGYINIGNQNICAGFSWMSISDDIKPYLRSMSSMTEEERNEYLSVKMQETERVALAEVYRPEAVSEILEWLNAHHFDYRGLIEKNLALEAPKYMYDSKSKVD